MKKINSNFFCRKYKTGFLFLKLKSGFPEFV